MMRVAAFLILLFNIQSQAFSQSAFRTANDTCTALIGSCEYYSCVEEHRLSCGPTGYPLGYGKKYCEKLSEIKFRTAITPLGAATFPVDGNLWIAGARDCLQEQMDDYFAKRPDGGSCEELQAFAFKSHPGCYTQNMSFCELPIQEAAKVGLSIAPEDLLKRESLDQIFSVAGICVKQLGDRIATEPSLLVRLNLRKYQILWKTIASDPSKLGQLSGDNLDTTAFDQP